MPLTQNDWTTDHARPLAEYQIQGDSGSPLVGVKDDRHTGYYHIARSYKMYKDDVVDQVGKFCGEEAA